MTIAEVEAAWGAPLTDDLLRRLHGDHACNFAPCSCRCGCREGFGCTALFGPLCSVCHLKVIRGDDDEHGPPAALAPQGEKE